jgi:hypothetical protein
MNRIVIEVELNIAYMKLMFYGQRVRMALIVVLMILMFKGNAQNRFGFRFRPGVSFPTTQREDVNMKTGVGFEFMGSYGFLPHLSLYAGWGWNRFSSDRSFAGSETDFEETGYVFGLMFLHPLPEDLPFAYFLRAGPVYNHIELEDKEGTILSDSGHGFGFQVETGFSFSLSDSWRLTPGIKYQTLSREIPIGGFEYLIDLNYLSVGATLSKSLQ